MQWWDESCKKRVGLFRAIAILRDLNCSSSGLLSSVTIRLVCRLLHSAALLLRSLVLMNAGSAAVGMGQQHGAWGTERTSALGLSAVCSLVADCSKLPCPSFLVLRFLPPPAMSGYQWQPAPLHPLVEQHRAAMARQAAATAAAAAAGGNRQAVPPAPAAASVLAATPAPAPLAPAPAAPVSAAPTRSGVAPPLPRPPPAVAMAAAPLTHQMPWQPAQPAQHSPQRAAASFVRPAAQPGAHGSAVLQQARTPQQPQQQPRQPSMQTAPTAKSAASWKLNVLASTHSALPAAVAPTFMRSGGPSVPSNVWQQAAAANAPAAIKAPPQPVNPFRPPAAVMPVVPNPAFQAAAELVTSNGALPKPAGAAAIAAAASDRSAIAGVASVTAPPFNPWARPAQQQQTPQQQTSQQGRSQQQPPHQQASHQQAPLQQNGHQNGQKSQIQSSIWQKPTQQQSQAVVAPVQPAAAPQPVISHIWAQARAHPPTQQQQPQGGQAHSAAAAPSVASAAAPTAAPPSAASAADASFMAAFARPGPSPARGGAAGTAVAAAAAAATAGSSDPSAPAMTPLCKGHSQPMKAYISRKEGSANVGKRYFNCFLTFSVPSEKCRSFVW